MSSSLKQKLAAGETVLCAKACDQDPELVELMASSGLDGIWICLEHRRTSPIAGVTQDCSTRWKLARALT